ncbi:MAG: PEP-CTERM sorting domain-containing protein [Planctomycetota bacterium]|nr:PEP-CTERM sorting domain-containing protein [Planctomycetota bacterium]
MKLRDGRARLAARLCFLAGLAGATSMVSAVNPSFTGIGDLAGGTFYSEARGVSPDGTKVVGYSIVGAGQSEAILFQNGILQSLGDLPGGALAGNAAAVTDSGVVVGEGGGVNGNEAFRYENGVFTALGGTSPTGFFGSGAYAVSANGEVIVGSGDRDPVFGTYSALWTNSGLQQIPDLQQDTVVSLGLGLSADGQVATGSTDIADTFTAYIWNPINGTFNLDVFPGSSGTFSQGNAVSGDGRIVVGYAANSGNFTIAARWDVLSVAKPLGILPGGRQFSEALATNHNGLVVVGRAGIFPTGTRAFIWDRTRGLRDLQNVLTELGVDTTGWVLRSATGISADGSVICGIGINPSGNTEGWVAVIPPYCSADFDGTGFIDSDDFVAFVAAFTLGCTDVGQPDPSCTVSADFDDTGFVDSDDFVSFVSAFEAGCE